MRYPCFRAGFQGTGVVLLVVGCSAPPPAATVVDRNAADPPAPKEQTAAKPPEAAVETSANSSPSAKQNEEPKTGAPFDEPDGYYGLGNSKGVDGGVGMGIGTIGHGAGTGVGQGFGGRGRTPTRGKLLFESVTVSGRIPSEVIQRIVRTSFGGYRTCYETGLRNNPQLEGTVRVAFVIDKDGKVIKADTMGSSMPDASVCGCIAQAFQALTFPSPEGGQVSVTYPLRFSLQ